MDKKIYKNKERVKSLFRTKATSKLVINVLLFLKICYTLNKPIGGFMNKIAFIRTGGQTGVDRAALDFARKYNIPIVGWCPKNGWAEDMLCSPGIRALYPELKETPEEDVSQRTIWNVRDSHATLIISPKHSTLSKGTNLTKQTAKEHKRPYLKVNSEEDVSKIIDWLDTLGNELTLNIGGPRESECLNAYQITINILEKVFKGVNDK